MNFEQSVKRLEEILQLLESGEAKLEEVNTLFAEGAEITKNCYKLLNDSKGKITVLRTELDKLVEKPFELKEDDDE